VTSIAPTTPPIERLMRPERTMVRVRWAGVAFGLLQVLTFYIPHPPGMLPVALGIVALLAVANTVLWAVGRRVGTVQDARRLSLASLAVDYVVVMGLVFVYTFDPETAIWAIMYFLPLEGAIRFQLPGAVWTTAAATLAYIGREAYGSIAFGYPFLIPSITFRTGIGFIIATVAGAMASSLVRERDQLEAAKAQLELSADELAAANTELQAANEVKDDFIAVTNHELRTPLTTILGYTTMLAHRWDEVPDERKRDFVRLVDQQSRRLLGLVEDLLTVSSAQAGALDLNLRTVELCDVVTDAIANNGEAAAEVANDCPPGLTVVADQDRLCQILTNYISNALKYGHPPVEVTAVARETTAEVAVCDRGTGVPEDFVPRLFDKFSQASKGASRTAAGTGLGLAIVRQLAEAQGGQAWYEPGEAGGSRFCLQLPRGEDRPTRAAQAQPGTAQA
jgi:signal transduction histidine kinase